MVKKRWIRPKLLILLKSIEQTTVLGNCKTATSSGWANGVAPGWGACTVGDITTCTNCQTI